MIFKSGVCAVCGHKESIEFDEKPFTMELDLKNYIKFRSIKLNQCSDCGYVAENLFDSVDDKIKDLVRSERYKNVLDYNFIEPFKELPDREYLDVDINRLEAFSLICKETGNNLVCARVLGKIADLKNSLAGAYLETKYTKDDDELNDSYDKVFEMLSGQAQSDNEECLNFLRGIKISNSLCKIFVAERLCFGFMYEQGRQIIDKLRQKTTFSKHLSNYIENFLTEVEQR